MKKRLVTLLCGIGLAFAFTISAEAVNLQSNLPQPYPWTSGLGEPLNVYPVGNNSYVVESLLQPASGSTDNFYYDYNGEWQTSFIQFTCDGLGSNYTIDKVLIDKFANGQIQQLNIFYHNADAQTYGEYINSYNSTLTPVYKRNLYNPYLPPYISGYTFNFNANDISTMAYDLSSNHTFPWQSDLSNLQQFYIQYGQYTAALLNNGAIYLSTNDTWNNINTLGINFQSFQTTNNPDGSLGTMTGYYLGGSAQWISSSDTWNISPFTEISADPANSNNAVYQVAVPIMSLNYSDMFTTGYNGFFYNIAITNNNTTTNLTEYPLTGFNMSGDSSSSFVINTKPETFQFIGPQYIAGTGTAPQITISLEGYNLNSSNQSSAPSVIYSIRGSLPAFSQDTTDYSNYNIAITPLSGNSIENISDGTCAIPFDVEIENSSNGQPVPNNSPLYNNLIFSYIQSGTAPSEGSVIGADISSSKEGYFAIIPASSIQDSNGDVQYGIDGNTLYNNVGTGHIYYLLCGPNAQSGATIQAELYGENGNATADTTVNMISNNQSNFTVSATNSGLNQTLGLQGPEFNGSTTYPSSNIYGYTDCSTTQYIIPNYIYSSTNSMPGIYILPEEGLNVQALQERFNWSKLVSGYRILPYDINGISESNPLDDSGFEWQYAAQAPVTIDGVTQTETFPISNFNTSMAGNILYDYLISAYGTIHTYSYTDSNELHTFNTGMNSYYVSNSADMPVYETQTYKADCGIPLNNYGLFMPPNSTASIYESEGRVEGQTFNSYYWSDNNIPVMSL